MESHGLDDGFVEVVAIVESGNGDADGRRVADLNNARNLDSIAPDLELQLFWKLEEDCECAFRVYIFDRSICLDRSILLLCLLLL